MKKVTILLLMAVLLLLLGCSQPSYVPRYSADQVITAVRADFPVCWKVEMNDGTMITEIDEYGQLKYKLVSAPTQISVKFVGGTSHAWRAKITCPKGYILLQMHPNSPVWETYFWETDGKNHIYYVTEDGQQHRYYPPE